MCCNYDAPAINVDEMQAFTELCDRTGESFWGAMLDTKPFIASQAVHFETYDNMQGLEVPNCGVHLLQQVTLTGFCVPRSCSFAMRTKGFKLRRRKLLIVSLCAQAVPDSSARIPGCLLKLLFGPNLLVGPGQLKQEAHHQRIHLPQQNYFTLTERCCCFSETQPTQHDVKNSSPPIHPGRVCCEATFDDYAERH